MYITQEIAARIKNMLKTQNKSMKNMLFELGLGINAVSEFSKGKQLSCISLAKIADYLDCSVDYLLGRTDNPEINRSAETNEYIEAIMSREKKSARSIGSIAAFGGAKQTTSHTKSEMIEINEMLEE